MQTDLAEGPVTIGSQQISRPFEFSVLNEEEKKFSRIVQTAT